MVYIDNRFFEWDPGKALLNEAKHGIGFEQAATVFSDLNALVFDDPKHSTLEQRKWILGHSDKNTLIVVFTERLANVTRIISARKANRKERRIYEKNSRI